MDLDLPEQPGDWRVPAQRMESFFFDQNIMRDAVNSARLGVQLHVHWRAFMHALIGATKP